MIVEVNYKEIQVIINKYYPDNPVTEAEAVEAFHNLVGFVNLLIKINDEVVRGS